MSDGSGVARSGPIGEALGDRLSMGTVDVAAVLELGPHARDLDAHRRDRTQPGSVLDRVDDGFIGLQLPQLHAQHRGDVVRVAEDRGSA